MKNCTRLVGLAMILMTGCAQAATQPGQIMLLEKCPGDSDADIKALGNEAFLGALLTPLLTGIVNSGLKLAGEKLKEAAQEAQVDVLHVGSHFYEWREGEASAKPTYWDLNSWCVVVASKQTKATKTNIADLVKGYKGYTATVSEDGTRALSNGTDGTTELATQLTNAGFAGQVTPGLLAVLDVELSAQKSEFRLVPRFVVMDHSIRERKADRYQRDVTLEFSFAVARGKDAFAKGLLKMEGLRINNAELQSPGDAQLASHWMALPALNDVEKTKMDAARTLKTQQATHEEAARLAAAAAIALKANEWEDAAGNKWEPIEPQEKCPAAGSSNDDWLRAHGLLQAEKAKPKKDTVAISLWANVVTYFDSCHKSQLAKAKLENSKTVVGALARSFDLTVAIKEFRKRPVAKFFGEILSDDATRKELTTGIVGAIDPATREAAAKEAAETRLALLTAYEDAVHKAQESMLAYESAKDEDKAAKLLKMHYDQRAANRAAEALGIALPYPEVGTWLGR